MKSGERAYIQGRLVTGIFFVSGLRALVNGI